MVILAVEVGDVFFCVVFADFDCGIWVVVDFSVVIVVMIILFVWVCMVCFLLGY